MDVDVGMVEQSTVDRCSCWKLQKVMCDNRNSECACVPLLARIPRTNAAPAISGGYCADCAVAKSQARREDEDQQEEFDSSNTEVVSWDARAGSGPSSDADGIFLSALANPQTPHDRATLIQTPSDQARHYYYA